MAAEAYYEQVLADLEANGQLVLRYLPQWPSVCATACRKASSAAQTIGRGTASAEAVAHEADYPDNPNGSMADVAGLCDATGRVLGLMPHPERHIDPTQHPRWTRGEAGQVGDGLKMFQNAVAYFA